MSLQRLVAALAAMSSMFAVLPAGAADLYGPNAYRDARPDDDPRYSDIYRHPPPQGGNAPYAPYWASPPRVADDRYDRRYDERYVDRYDRRADDDHGPRYAERSAPSPVPSPTWRDDRGYLRPMAPSRYPLSGRSRDDGARHCTPRDVIRARLERRGWHAFRDLDLQGGVVILEARRANGRSYALSLDRCTGQVLEARPIRARAAMVRPPHPRDRPYGY